MCGLAQRMKTLYVTGEESLQQVAMRAGRLGLPTDKLRMLSETSVEQICLIAQQEQPQIMVIDSIQVMHVADVQSAPGSVSQVRESAALLTRYAKQNHVAIFMVGHVTKDGTWRAPRCWSTASTAPCCWMAGTTRVFAPCAPTRTASVRSTNWGLRHDRAGNEGGEQPFRDFPQPRGGAGSGLHRHGDLGRHAPLLVELQALVDYSQLSNPRRVAVGMDHNRLAMLLAVLHRHGGLQMADQDVFINVVGGVKVEETSADLALLLAMVSSFRDQAPPKDLVVFGEVGLSGEIRPVPSGQERLQEAAKHGFRRAIVPHANAPKHPIEGMEVVPVKKLSDALEAL